MNKSFYYKFFSLFLVVLLEIIILSSNSGAAESLADKLSGRILLQVEDCGQAWYVLPDNNQRIYLGNPRDAFNIMKTLGVGIKSSELNQYLSENIFPNNLLGKILLDVEKNGEAYYINPIDSRGYYLGRPQDAFSIMKESSLGISNQNLEEIPVFELSSVLFSSEQDLLAEDQNIKDEIILITHKPGLMSDFSHIISVSATLSIADDLIIKEKGILYDFTIFPKINLIPTLDNYKQKIVFNSNNNDNTYVVDITNLIPGTYPFIRSYIITFDNQIIYGNVATVNGVRSEHLPFLPIPSESIVSGWSCGDKLDYSDQTYSTVKIGNQCWIAENLNVGEMLCSSTPGDIKCSSAQTDNSIIEKYCYNNLESNCDLYGGLYTWNEMMDYTTSTLQGICPTGWHIPTHDEFTDLERRICLMGGNTQTICDARFPKDEITKGIIGDDEGYKLKSKSWDGNNWVGFSVLKTGYAMWNGDFINFDTFSLIWQSSKSGDINAWDRGFKTDRNAIGRGTSDKKNALSVRCLMD